MKKTMGCINSECDVYKNKRFLTEGVCPKCNSALVHVCAKCYKAMPNDDKYCFWCAKEKEEQNERTKKVILGIGGGLASIGGLIVTAMFSKKK